MAVPGPRSLRQSLLRQFLRPAHPLRNSQYLIRSSAVSQASSYSSTSTHEDPPSRLNHNPYRDDLSEAVKTNPHNPLDAITLHRLDAARRAYYQRRSYYAAAGAVICMLVPLLAIQFYDLSDAANDSKARTDAAPAKDGETFQGRPVVVSGTKTQAQEADGKPGVELVPTGTSSVPHFPKTIKLPSVSATGVGVTKDEYQLVGLGIRTVSFLRVQVYVVGLYIHKDDIAALQAGLVRAMDPVATTLVAGEKDRLRERLLDPEEGAALWDGLLRCAGLRTALRIVPTRNTDFAHLRDGWVRGITAKTREAAQKGNVEYEEDEFGAAMQDFKALLGGKGKAPKGSCLLLTRDEKGNIAVLYQEKDGQGEVERFGQLVGPAGENIGRLVWMGYLAGKNVSSEECRRKVIDGVMDFVERPIGTVATQVT